MKPYVHDVLNTMEAAALFTAFLTLCSGVFMFSKSTTDAWRSFLTIFIFVVNGSFLAFAGRCLYLEVQRGPKVPGPQVPSAVQGCLDKTGLGPKIRQFLSSSSKTSESPTITAETETTDASNTGTSASEVELEMGGLELPKLSKAGSEIGVNAADGANPMAAQRQTTGAVVMV